MKLSREWATPLTIGAFGLMAITGMLMFFHLETGLNKLAHEWLGWLMVAGVAAHAGANWPGFKRHFASSAAGRAIIVASLLVTAASFIAPPGKGQGTASPPLLALGAVTSAPLSTVAVLSGKPVDQLVAQLNQAGIRVSGPDSSLDNATGGKRELVGKAMRIVFGTP